MAYDDDDYFVPLEDQRVFGAGIKRKRVQFVPSTDPNLATTASKTQKSTPSSSVGDTYLSIVLKQRSKSEPTEQNKELRLEDQEHESLSSPSTPPPAANNSTTDRISSTATEIQETEPQPIKPKSASQPPPHSTCEICDLPIHTTSASFKTHHASIAHQVCLQHSHPPSHIDRTRSGLKYLSSYGWDPDSRRGLGTRGEGIREPLKGKIKNDTVGLGVPEGRLADLKKRRERDPPPLNAKEVRRREAEGKKKDERLREMFYRNDDVEKYLGGG